METIERMVKDVTVSEAEATRDRRLSLTMMNCIWARHTDTETRDPVEGDVTGRASRGCVTRYISVAQRGLHSWFACGG